MLSNCRSDPIQFDVERGNHPEYRVEMARIEIVDSMTAHLSAVFKGPANASVIGRAWISDAEGTLVHGQTGDIKSGSRHEIRLTIPQPKKQIGDLIACMRVEWPLYQTKHVIQATLIRGKSRPAPNQTDC